MCTPLLQKVQLWGALGDCGSRALWSAVGLPHAVQEYSLKSVWLGRLERATLGLARLVGTAPERTVSWVPQRLVLHDGFENAAYNLECDGCEPATQFS